MTAERRSLESTKDQECNSGSTAEQSHYIPLIDILHVSTQGKGMALLTVTNWGVAGGTYCLLTSMFSDTFNSVSVIRRSA